MIHKVAAVAAAGILAAFLSAGTAFSQSQTSSEPPQQQQQQGEDRAENAGEPGGKAESEKGKGKGGKGKGNGKGKGGKREGGGE